MVRPHTVVLVVLLVSATGYCSVGAPSSASSPSPTSASLSTQTGTNASADAANATGPFPPGASASGIENASRLLHAHRVSLNATSYAARLDSEEAAHLTTANGTFRGFEVRQNTVTVEKGANGSEVRIESENSSTTYWFTGGATVTNHTERNRGATSALYEYSRGSDSPSASERYLVDFSSQLLQPYLRDLEYEHVETVTRDDRTLHRYASTGIDETVEPNVGDTPVTSTTDDITATVVVSERGIIRSFTARETHSLRNETVTAEQNYTVEELGETTTVAPAWVTDEIARFDVSLTDDGSVVALSHVGGRSVSNPGLFFHTPNSSTRTEVDGTIESGNTVYVALMTNEGSGRTLRTSVNEPPAVNGSFVNLSGGNLSVTAWRTVFGSYDSGVQLEVTRHERPARSNAGNATSGVPPVAFRPATEEH